MMIGKALRRTETAQVPRRSMPLERSPEGLLEQIERGKGPCYRMSRLACRCAGLIVPMMVVSRSGFVHVKRRMNSFGHAVEQVTEMGLAPALPLQPGLLPLGWRPFCGTAANDDACALLSGRRVSAILFLPQ
jgi:hypothetical protein